jgi:hypothetical protein
MAQSDGGRAAALGAIGGTPIVRLTRIAGPEAAEVWVKLEGANPTGSYKDRMALAMVEGAERDGRLRPGQTVVEYTGGSTGSSLAFVCAIKGYPTRIVSSDAFAEEKLATMRAFGATLDVLPSPDGITPQLIPAMRERALAIAEEVGGFLTDQFNNHDMPTGYHAMGEEILDLLQRLGEDSVVPRRSVLEQHPLGEARGRQIGHVEQMAMRIDQRRQSRRGRKDDGSHFWRPEASAEGCKAGKCAEKATTAPIPHDRSPLHRLLEPRSESGTSRRLSESGCHVQRNWTHFGCWSSGCS